MCQFTLTQSYKLFINRKYQAEYNESDMGLFHVNQTKKTQHIVPPNEYNVSWISV